MAILVKIWKNTSILLLRQHCGQPLKDNLNPALVWANWYYFRPGESVSFPIVESVCILWSARGSGTVRSAGENFEVGPGSVLVLPWQHDIDYRANPVSPFQLGTLHVVPNLKTTREQIDLGVGIKIGDGIFGRPDRRENPTTALMRPIFYDSASLAARNLIQLGGYSIQHFQDGETSVEVLRSLGYLLYLESGAVQSARNSTAPAALSAMKEFMLQNLARSISAAEIAFAARLSLSSAQRLFIKHEGVTPKTWLARVRLQQASFLLQTTNMRMHEVAFQVGFKDSLYFSKVFRERFGVPPSKFALKKNAKGDLSG